MNNEYPVFLRKDEWEDVIDFMACMAFDIERSDELRAYAIQLIEAIKEQLYVEIKLPEGTNLTKVSK